MSEVFSDLTDAHYRTVERLQNMDYNRNKNSLRGAGKQSYSQFALSLYIKFQLMKNFVTVDYKYKQKSSIFQFSLPVY